jgi:hypothetical protein
MPTVVSPPPKRDGARGPGTRPAIKQWISGTLQGHLVFFEIIAGLPAIIYGLVSNELEGTLTASFAVVMILELIAIVAVAAAAVWYTITLPLIRRVRK